MKRIELWGKGAKSEFDMRQGQDGGTERRRVIDKAASLSLSLSPARPIGGVGGERKAILLRSACCVMRRKPKITEALAFLSAAAAALGGIVCVRQREVCNMEFLFGGVSRVSCARNCTTYAYLLRPVN